MPPSGPPGWTARSPSAKGVEGPSSLSSSSHQASTGAPGGGVGNPSHESDGGVQRQQQAQAGWLSTSPTGPITPCSAEEAELLVAAADTGRRTAAARGSVSPPGSRTGLGGVAAAATAAAGDGSPSAKDCISNGVEGGGRSPVAHKGGGAATKPAAAVTTPAARGAAEAEAVSATSEATGRGGNGSSSSERSSRSDDGLETTRSPPTRLPGIGHTAGNGGLLWGAGVSANSGREDGAATAAAAVANGVRESSNKEQKQSRRSSPRGSDAAGGEDEEGEEESGATKAGGAGGEGRRATKQSSSPRVVAGGVRPPSSSVSTEAEGGQAGETVTTSKHQARSSKMSESETYCRGATTANGTPPGKSVHVYE